MNKSIILCLCLFGLLGQIRSNFSKERLSDYDVNKKVILTPDAPQPIGPYNQAVQINYLLYLSGQIGIDPATGQLVPGDIRNQTVQVFHNIEAVLHAAGANMTQIARCLVLLTDMNDFAAVNEVYATFFASSTDYPARTTFAVKSLPKNASVEIECTAYTKQE
jgi:2-iminobutanoate/2-iminopropanoate deaminase